MSKRTTTVAVLDVEVGACFPKLREEFLIERRLQIANSFRTAGASLRANHALDHLYVMRAPEREIFIMFEQRFGELKLFVAFLEVGKNFEHCPGALAIGLSSAAWISICCVSGALRPTALKYAKETVSQRRTCSIALLKTFVRKLVTRNSRRIFLSFNPKRIQSRETALIENRWPDSVDRETPEN